MKTKTPNLIFGSLLFISGLAIGLVFSGLALWVNLEGMAFWGYPESIAYDSSLTKEAKIGRLDCPILLTDGETGTIRLPISNTIDSPTTAWIKAHLSMPGRVENMVRRLRSVELAPGEESEMRWLVTTDNTIYGRMILVRVFLQLTEFHPPAQTQHCGIISANLWGLSSTQILTVTVGSSLLLILGGAYIIWRSIPDWTRKAKGKAIIPGTLGALTIISMIGGLFRVWEVILAAVILIPILIFSAVGYYIGQMNSRYN